MDNQEKIQRLVKIRDYLKNPDAAKFLSQMEVENAAKMTAYANILKVMTDIQVIKGDPGYSPVKGTDYFTNDEIAQVRALATPRKGIDYFTPEEAQGLLKVATPVKGKDYRDGIDGVNGLDGVDAEQPNIEEIVNQVLAAVKLPEQQAIILDTSEQLRDKLSSLSKDARLDISAIKGFDGLSADILNRAISILDSRTSFLINKINNLLQSSSGTVPNFADAETPSGTVDGVNVTFTLAHTPNPAGSLMFTVNGQTLTPGGSDYTLAGATVTLVTAPPTGFAVRAWYRY